MHIGNIVMKQSLQAITRADLMVAVWLVCGQMLLRFTIRRKINYVSCEGGIKYISLPCFGFLFPEIFCF
jgi:hypothetical protein